MFQVTEHASEKIKELLKYHRMPLSIRILDFLKNRETPPSVRILLRSGG